MTGVEKMRRPARPDEFILCIDEDGKIEKVPASKMRLCFLNACLINEDDQLYYMMAPRE